MIWLTWRQFRGQAVTALAALAALTIYLVVLGLRIRHSYEATCGTGCSLSVARQTLENLYSHTLLLGGLLVVLVPAIIGAFWGAPMIAREIETGTHQLVWHQSVTRTRWLAVKLVVVTLAGVALTGALSALFTWAASPYDRVFDNRFNPALFPTRNVAPLGYAVFAIVAGTAVGLLARRTVMAMAITLAAFGALQILMPAVIRPHLQPPVTQLVAFTAETMRSFGINREGAAEILEYKIPGAWVLSFGADVLDATGKPVAREQITRCMPGNGFDRDTACLEAQNLHLSVTYQPADRYWTFQWLELATYLVLAGLLAGFTFWRISRGLN